MSGVGKQGVAGLFLGQFNNLLRKGVVGAGRETDMDAVPAEVFLYLAFNQNRDEFFDRCTGSMARDCRVYLGVDFRGSVSVAVQVVESWRRVARR